LPEFKTALEKANVKYTGTVYGTDKLKGEAITPYHMETILRTNFADVYNRGRDSFFNDPDVVEFVPAFQYSAILDSRTRDDHRKMDGRIYNRDDPIWQRWSLPAGYNCRCIRVPVTVNQQYSVSNPTNLKPDEGFGGRADI
jgi:SPP1 gp7 family putative phage head morphogenesis protein